jgi:hypothetical protein|tara:strand:+ start:247 stop:840 length:594 start_codon:yes stop_codon:yes gene_type:complete
MRKLIVDIAKKANKKLVDKIARSRELKAGLNPSNPRARAARNRIRRGAQKTAKNIYKGTAAGTGVATGSTATGVAASRAGSKPNTQASKPTPPAKPKPSTKPKGKAFDVAGLRAAYNKAMTPAKKKAKAPLGPKNQPVKKVAKKKLAKATTVKGAAQRGQDALGRKFDKMTQAQINRLGGKSAAAYRKYKKAQKGKK